MYSKMSKIYDELKFEGQWQGVDQIFKPCFTILHLKISQEEAF